MRCSASLAALALFLSAQQTVAEYEFLKIAEEGDGYSILDFEPSLNNHGQVAFVGTTDVGMEGVFTSDGVTTSVVADSLMDFFVDFHGDAIINSAGTVLFEEGANGWVKYENGGFRKILPSTPHLIRDQINIESMNDAGVAVMSARLHYDNGRAIATADGDSIETIFQTDPLLWHGLQNPAINNNGRVAFLASRFANPEVRAIIVDDGEGPEVLVSNAEQQNYYGISLADDGSLAYTVSQPGNSSYAVLHRPGEDPLEFAHGLDVGNVVLLADGRITYRSNQSEILIGNTDSTESIIAVGDPLFGSTVFSIASNPNGYNDFGQVAFRAVLADGTTGIFLASDVATPEFCWNRPGGGFWSEVTSWSPTGVPNGDTIAVLGNVLAAPATVVIDADTIAPLIHFDSPVSYNLAGVGALRLVEPRESEAIAVQQGDHQIQAVVSVETDSQAFIESGASLSLNNQVQLNGGTLTKTGGGRLAINHDQIEGDGTLQVAGGLLGGTGKIGGALVNAGGVVNPGNSVGLLTVGGDFEQHDSAALSIELTGPHPEDYDRMEVEGTARLGGELRLTIAADDFEAIPLEPYTFLQAGVVDGVFDTLSDDMAMLPDGLAWKVIYGEHELTLTLSHPADFNLDGQVSLADYSVWRDSLGRVGAGLQADANGDGIIDLADYNVWGSSFGLVAGATGAGQSPIPEPSAISFILISLLMPSIGQIRRIYVRRNCSCRGNMAPANDL